MAYGLAPGNMDVVVVNDDLEQVRGVRSGGGARSPAARLHPKRESLPCFCSACCFPRGSFCRGGVASGASAARVGLTFGRQAYGELVDQLAKWYPAVAAALKDGGGSFSSLHTRG